MDSSGTAGSAFIITEQREQRDAFLELLKQLEQGQGPTASAEQLKAADAKLNKVYQDVRKYRNAAQSFSSVTQDGIQKTQRVWLTYRDAWLTFAKVHFPSVSREALAHELTTRRTAELQEFLVH